MVQPQKHGETVARAQVSSFGKALLPVPLILAQYQLWMKAL